MSPQTARALTVGDHIAIRGESNRANFSNVGKVTKKTRDAIYVHFLRASGRRARFAFSDLHDMRRLRRAGSKEIAAYERPVQ